VDLLHKVDVVAMAIQFVVLLYSLSIHEAAHAWMADRLGDNTARYLGRVTINPIAHIDPIGTILFPLLQFFTKFPLLGWAKPVPINSAHLRNPHRDQIFISLAGPGSNFIAGCAAFLILLILKIFSLQANLLISFMVKTWSIPPQHSILVPIIGILFFSIITNWGLTIFNLIPIPPLDGHWLLYALLPPNAAAAVERYGTFGFIILYALLFMRWLSYIFIPIELMLNLLK
jgi:Zn-dependent protease